MAESQTNDNNTCVVCFKNVLYYSVGECDHPVCFECSTRMRVLCLQNECPICRQDLARVVFTETVQPYKELCKKVFSDRLFERQFKIGFFSEEIKHAYERLLENCCSLCDKIPFRTFTMLTDHMRKVHERYYCDLCVKHLKIFTNERKCYTRQELAHHRRKGDVDDTSHRGHPLCEFCEERFMDADELYRHLRKEHLYCHLCDADGRNLYYASHSALAHHFRTEHYLCEDGECAGQHLTAVFRSEIDLKAHKATVHGRGMPRGAARQARTLELQFNITPHPVVQRATRTVEQDREPENTESIFVPAGRSLDPQSDEQFPRLSAAPPAPAPLLPTPSSRSYRGSDGLTRNDKNFPALDGSGPSRPPPARPAAATVLRSSASKPGLSIQVHSQPASASNFRLTQTSSNRITHMPAQKKVLGDDDFPSLGNYDDHPSFGAGSVQAPKVTLINSEELKVLKNNQQNHQPKKAPLSAEAFPALSSSAAPAAPPQWITVSKSKEKPKAKPEPPPTPKVKTFNPIADFPTLPVNPAPPISNSKPKPKKTQPQPQPQPPPASVQTENNKNKKEKKKQNSKKENYVDLSLPDDIGDFKKSKDYIAACVNNNNSSAETDKKIKTVTESQSSTQRSNVDFKLAPKEYPPLSAKVDNVPSRPVQNGSVPPGFKKRPSCNGMTFTNSSGQTFSAPVHAYIPPPDFEQRNCELVKKFVAALGSAAAVEDFKVASRAFRDSIISADEFYRHCKSAMGAELDAVFPDLVALLPDIAKQQELVVGRDLGSKLDMCATCGQLLSPADRVSHNSAHWPPLVGR